MKGHRGQSGIVLLFFSTSALEGVRGQCHISAGLPLEKRGERDRVIVEAVGCKGGRESVIHLVSIPGASKP